MGQGPGSSQGTYGNIFDLFCRYWNPYQVRVFLVAQMVKNLPAEWEIRVQSRAGKIPWRREWQLTPVFLPGKVQGQRSLVSYSPWDGKKLDTTERLRLSLSFHTRLEKLTICCPHAYRPMTGWNKKADEADSHLLYHQPIRSIFTNWSGPLWIIIRRFLTTYSRTRNCVESYSPLCLPLLGKTVKSFFSILPKALFPRFNSISDHRLWIWHFRVSPGTVIVLVGIHLACSCVYTEGQGLVEVGLPFCTYFVLTSLCHVLRLCHSFKDCALPPSCLNPIQSFSEDGMESEERHV